MPSTPPTIIQNLTSKRLRIQGNDDHVIILPPLEKHREISEEDEEKYFPGLRKLAMQNHIRIVETKDPGNLEAQIQALLIGCGMTFAVISYITYQILTDDGKKAADPQVARYFKLGIPISLVVAIVIGALLLYTLRKGDKGRGFLQSITRWIAQTVSLLLILTVGLVLPALAFYFFGGGRELMGSQNSLAKMGRTLQLIFIFTASLLPALLYFLFDRQQLGTLRQRFEQQIFRLDPNVQSLCDVAAKYGRQIDEIYGRESAGGEGRLVRGTRWPILVATLVITVGWMLTLLPAGPPQPDNMQPGQLLDFFMPPRSAVVFGFLGAYFFVLNTVLHRYVRADLKPKAYSSITVRILIVFILSWVVGLELGTSTFALTLTFLIGVFPESALTLIRESIRNQTGLFGRPVGLIGSRPRERYPLTELEELDVYDRARLLDEGVTNIEGLAHHDLIDLMLETRISVPRLVDWVDQAILYLHVEFDNGNRNGNRTANKKPENGKPETPNSAVATTEDLLNLKMFLRDNGIRTATDFIDTYSKRNESTLHLRASNDQQTRLQILSESLKDDEWLDYIKHWRVSSETKEIPLDASGPVKENPPG